MSYDIWNDMDYLEHNEKPFEADLIHKNIIIILKIFTKMINKFHSFSTECRSKALLEEPRL